MEDITITPQNFKPDPSLVKYRSEHDLFDEALENFVNNDIIDFPDIPMTKTNQTDELHHTIRGVITTRATTEHPAPAGIAEPAAVIGGTDTVPPFPPPPFPGSANTARSDDETFPETNSLTDPIQVHTTSSVFYDD